VLIDFTKLAPDVALGGQQSAMENKATLVDFSDVAGASFDEATRKMMKSSLAVPNWQVVLASSARTVENMTRSMTKVAVTSKNAQKFDDEEMANLSVLGVRVHFPMASCNSYAVIKPPFEIPAHAVKTELQGDQLQPVQGDLGTKFDGYGVVRNVGVLKSVSATVYGNNFPNGFGLILKDQNGEEKTIFLDYLQFDGWRKLVWNNPNYISEVRNREMRQYPLYPHSVPFVKLDSLVFYRDSAQEGGDVITYIKDIEVTYDVAIIEKEADFDHEGIWNILTARQEARRQAELKRVGNLQVLRYLEQQKMHKEVSQ
jgi:hypothetical protein